MGRYPNGKLPALLQQQLELMVVSIPAVVIIQWDEEYVALLEIVEDALAGETEVGSIRAGKMADFAVLEQDPFEVGAKGLKDIPVWGTVFEGEVHPVKK